MFPVGIASWDCISPIGSDWTSTWESLLECRAEISRASQIGLGLNSEIQVSAIPNLNRRVFVDERINGAACRLAVKPTLRLIRKGKFKEAKIFGGSAYGETDILEEIVKGDLTGTDSTPAKWSGIVEDPIPKYIGSTIGKHGCECTIESWVTSACTSAMHALLFATLRLGSDPHIVVGVDAQSSVAISGFNAVGALGLGCKPFASSNDNILLAEGATALVINNSVDHPSTILIKGVGLCCEAYSDVRPREDGSGLAKAIEQALQLSRLTCNDIDSIILHGTGTKLNDLAELNGLRRVFGSREIPATSIKGTLGHTMGASGLFNLLTACQTLDDSVLPPTFLKPEKLIGDIDLVVGTPRKLVNCRNVLSLCSGFGGNNVATILGY